MKCHWASTSRANIQHTFPVFSWQDDTGLVFCCCSPSLQRFDVLCIQRSYSAFLGCKKWLFYLLLLFYYMKPFFLFWPFNINKAFLSIQLLLPECFLFFGPLCVNPRDDCVSESQLFPKYSDQPAWHPQPRDIESHLNRFSYPFCCSVCRSAICLDHVFMPNCIKLQPFDELISYLC